MFKNSYGQISWQKILIAVAVVAVLVALIVLCVKVGKMDTTNDVAPSQFKVGGLGSTGLETESTATIVMRDYITVDGLAIEIKDDATIQYKVFFYTDEKVFISASSSWLDEDFDADDIPSTAVYCKVVIDPTEDSEVTLLEVSKYAKQLTITYED